MQTELIGPESLVKAAELLKNGELVAFPTETVYGLGAAIFNVSAIRKIFEVKKRPSDNPLIAHISSLADLERIATDIPQEFYLLAEAFFPGPLTVLLPKHPDVSSEVTAGLSMIAVRMPAHLIARKLIALVGEPLVAPSANLSGKPSSTHHLHALDDFQDKIAAIVEGGECHLGLESTVISLQDPALPVVLRPGEIQPSQIEEVLKKKVLIFSSKIEAGAPPSPGMKYRHYAPRARVKVFYTETEFLSYITLHPESKKMLLVSQKRKADFPFADTYAVSNKDFYSILRFSDKKEYDEILIFCDEEIQQNAALMNRLSRAAGVS